MPSAPPATAILVIDDDRDVREMVAEAIASTGRVAFTATDGSQALRLLDDSGVPRPCLILLDSIPGPMGEADFLARLRAREDGATLPVFLMTANARAVASSAGPAVLGTLQKPFGLEELLAVLDAHC